MNNRLIRGIGFYLIMGMIVPLAAQTGDDTWLYDQGDLSEEEADRRNEALSEEMHILYLNSSSAEKLMENPLFTPQLARAIVAFRDTSGPFMTIYELLSVPGMEKDLLLRMAPWISLQPPARGCVHTLSVRMARKFSADNSTADLTAGSPWKVLFRYKIEGDRWSAGLKGEKDTGEPMSSIHTPPGFDFYSAYLTYEGARSLRQLVVGDYRIIWGNGLLCNQSFGPGNDASLLYNPHCQRIIKKHTSMDEYLFFRGVAMRWKFQPFNLILFGSIKPIDGNITEVDSTTGKATIISSIKASGLHATVSDLEDKYAITEYAGGASFRFQKKHLSCGLQGMSVLYSAPIEPQNTFSNRYRFRGNEMHGASADFIFFNKWSGFSAELAINNGEIAMNQVALIKPGDGIALWINTRYYAPGYHAPYASSIGRSSTLSGESGANAVVVFTPRYGTTLKCKTDIYQISSPGGAPVSGKCGRIMYAEFSSGHQNFRYLIRIFGEEQNELTISTPAPELSQQNLNPWVSYGLRAELLFNPLETISVKMRFESRWNSSLPSEKGWLLLSDIDYKNKKNRVRVVFRHAIFNANQYSLRLYCREHDALWAYSTSILYGTGSRSYLLIHLKKIGPLQCWIKFGNTFKINTTSSLEKNLQSDIALQTNISF